MRTPDGLDAGVAGPYDRVDIGNEFGVESSRTMPTFNRRWIVILVVAAVVAGGVAWLLFPSANHGPLHVLLVDSPPPTPPLRWHTSPEPSSNRASIR